MSTNIVPIGCVTSTDINDTGFVSYSDFIGNVNNVEECLQKAETYGNLCLEKNENGSNNTCSFIAYRDGEIEDLLRKADSEYQKVKNCQTEVEKNKYLNKSLDLFKKIWLNYTPDERKRQLNGKINDTGRYEPFLGGFAPWIKKKLSYMEYFEKNVNSDRVPIQMKNTCWLGGKNILNTNYVELVDLRTEKNQNRPKNPNCKYGLYPVPGTNGENMADRMKKFYHQLAEKDNKLAKEAAIKAQTSNAMAKFVNNPDSSKLDIFSLFKAAQNEKAKLELDAATKDARESINSKLEKLGEQQRIVELINPLTETTRKAINSNIDLVKDKQQISNKMNADLQTLNWSLEESEKKEMLQNKITTTLGIIIMLFACLCIGLMVYHLIGGTMKDNIRNNTNKRILDNIFGLNKKGNISFKNKKILKNIFS